MDGDALRLALRRGQNQRFLASTKTAVRPRKCAAVTAPLAATGCVRSTTETVSLRVSDHESRRSRSSMQLSKPSAIILPGRLRPMKTMRLSRFSPSFHGR